MSPILLTISVIIAIALLMAIQGRISKLKSLYWGAIIPLGILIAAVYAHFYVRIDLLWSSVMVFVVPFLWSLEEWYRGRKKRIEEMEKEITKMKAKDI